MERNAKSILDDVLRLPEADRAEIASALLESIEPDAETDIEAAWRWEVASRIAAMEAGEVETVAWEDFRDKLHARAANAPRLHGARRRSH